MKALTNNKINSSLTNKSVLATTLENAETVVIEKNVFGVTDLWNIYKSRRTSFLRSTRALSIY